MSFQNFFNKSKANKLFSQHNQKEIQFKLKSSLEKKVKFVINEKSINEEINKKYIPSHFNSSNFLSPIPNEEYIIKQKINSSKSNNQNERKKESFKIYESHHNQEKTKNGNKKKESKFDKNFKNSNKPDHFNVASNTPPIMVFLNSSFHRKDTIEHIESPLPLYISVDSNKNYYFKEKYFNYKPKYPEIIKVKTDKLESHDFLSIESQDDFFIPMNNENESYISLISQKQKSNISSLSKKTKSRFFNNSSLNEINEIPNSNHEKLKEIKKKERNKEK